MRTIRFMFSIFAFILVLAVVSVHVVEAEPLIVATPAKQVYWAWRKSFKDIDLRNLALAWNGSKLIFSASEKTGPNRSRGDVIVGIGSDGKALRDWLARGSVRKLSFDGEGKHLLAELADGNFLLYGDWSAEQEPVFVGKSLSGAILSPKGDYFLVSAPVSSLSDQRSFHALSSKGELLWYCPGEPAHPGPVLFPFLEKDRQVLYGSKNNELVLSDGPNVLWKVQLQGRPIALASSFLEGGVIAATTSGEKGEVRFFDDKGATTGFALFPGGALSLSCSKIGNYCAALSNGPDEQRLSLFMPNGKEVWRHVIKTRAPSPSSAVVADQGRMVIAGFEEKGQWSLRAWDSKGKPLWTAPIEGGLADFKVSWSGKRIAVLTKDGRIAFFDLSEKK